MELPGRTQPRRPHLFALPLPLALAALAVFEAAGAAACKAEHPAAAPRPPAPEAAAIEPRLDLALLSARVGVKPGGLATPGVGPDGSLMWTAGTVTVRRVGQDQFVEATAKMPLFSGDTVWTGPHTEATVALADETLVQLAEETALVVGNRAISADPASSVAILYGVARVSVSPRARGEGPFLTTAGTAIVAAKGTAFAVGVVAGGVVRVGLEHGEVEVAGAQALDKPLTLGPAEAATIDAAGTPTGPAEFKRDDWGDWRFATEQSADLSATARFHADRLLGGESRLDSNYLLLQKLVTSASTLTWKAESNTTPKAAGEYKATAPERAAAIEATYRLATEIARQTHAVMSDAFILSELRARHPAELGTQISEFTQEIAGAQLYGKKLQLVSTVYLGPLRSAYYAHTARGRARAASLDMPAPSFAQVKLTDVPAAEIAKRVPGGLYVPPRLESTTHLHPLWQRAPKLGWDERLTLQPVPERQGSWYVAPTRVQAHVLAGVPPAAPAAPQFPAVAATDPAQADLTFLVPPFPPIGTNQP
jgi:ferric-dicitrate binding protein FerR (iron transport regulator)